MNPFNPQWQRHPLLSALKPQDYRLVSFDLFDTLLHRAVRTPADVFVLLGEWAVAQDGFDTALDAHAFASLRAGMERQARRRRYQQSGHTEVTLDEIWAQAPAYLHHPEQLLARELELEYALSFPNPYSLAYLECLRTQGIPVCITSDTYFSEDFIRRLLHKAGIRAPESLPLVLSNVHQANKASGQLFKMLRDLYAPLEYHEILHLGDNLSSDVLQAQPFGIQAIHFAPIANPQALSEREALLAIDTHADPTYPLRQLGRIPGQALAAATPETCFFEHGATLLGPSMGLFALWVVQDAARRGITLLCPIMREAVVLTPLLQQAVTLLGYDITVTAFYASRQAAFLPVMRQPDERALRHYITRRHFRLGDFMAELQLPSLPATLYEAHDKRLSDLAGHPAFDAWLASEPVQQAAIAASAEARALLQEYAQPLLAGHERIGFVDLGPNANTLTWLAECLTTPQTTAWQHYIFHAKDTVVDNRLRGHQIANFFGHSPEAIRLAELMNRSHEVIEVALTGSAATTIGYQRCRDSQQVQPQTRRIFEHPEQAQWLAHSTRGIERAWEHIAYMVRFVRLDTLLSQDARLGIARQWQRLLELPTAAEARYLGALRFDDNVGTRVHTPICAEADHARCQQQGVAAFMAEARAQWGYYANGIRWPQGVVTQVDPEYLLQAQRTLFNDQQHRLICRTLLDRAQALGWQRLVVYGAGVIGFELLAAAQHRGLTIVGLVDSNPSLQGTVIQGQPIITLAAASQLTHDGYIVASVAFARGIRHTIQDFYRTHNLNSQDIVAIDQ